jgi:hypothetical protein
MISDKIKKTKKITHCDLNYVSESRNMSLSLYVYKYSCKQMLCYVMLCYVKLCYVMLCYVMLCYVMLCYVTVTFATLIL